MACIKMFCIPYAGGSGYLFKKWEKYLDKSIKLYPVELSGRGARFTEKLSKNLMEILEDAYQQIVSKIDGEEYAILGYSMGAIITFEVVRKLQENSHKLPKHVFFCAQNAPHNLKQRDTYLLSDEEFYNKILQLGGTPKEIINNTEMRNIYGKILRSDYEALETYTFERIDRKVKSTCSIIYGQNDLEIENIEAWNDVIENKVEYYKLNGNHFFINDLPQEVFNIINNSLISDFAYYGVSTHDN